MQLIKEMTHPDGTVERHIIKPKTSLDQVGDFLGDMNQGIGHALSPFSFVGGFSVSTSWVLFFIMCMADSASSPWIGVIWLLSMFVRFR
jgi:hypothetical protein